jgi:D-sedoheptulose 7-phosphate isomerase
MTTTNEDKKIGALKLQRDWRGESYISHNDFWTDTYLLEEIYKVAECISHSIVEHNGKTMFCGSGGSSSAASHAQAEFLNQFCLGRTQPLPAIDLTAMTSTITAISNDWGYKYVFSKQVEGLGNKGDVLIGISTSGKSENVLRAIDTANSMSIHTVLLTGVAKPDYVYKDNDNIIKVKPDYLLAVGTKYTAFIQDNHSIAIHLLVGLVDYLSFGVNYFDKSTWLNNDEDRS